jgi:serine/threonine protein kinase
MMPANFDFCRANLKRGASSAETRNAVRPGKVTRLGAYEILSPIGADGMGEVKKARDTRLDRAIAIKVLPPHTAERPDTPSALRTRGPRCFRAQSPAHLRAVRHRARGRTRLPGDGVPGRTACAVVRCPSTRRCAPLVRLPTRSIAPTTGRKFLVLSAPKVQSSVPLVMVLNWAAGIGKP